MKFLKNSAGQTDPFVAEAYTDQQGKWRPMYRMTRDGFTFLVMGFTGEKAARFKWLYIAEFNRIEAALARGSGQREALLVMELLRTNAIRVNNKSYTFKYLLR